MSPYQKRRVLQALCSVLRSLQKEKEQTLQNCFLALFSPLPTSTGPASVPIRKPFSRKQGSAPRRPPRGCRTYIVLEDRLSCGKPGLRPGPSPRAARRGECATSSRMPWTRPGRASEPKYHDVAYSAESSGRRTGSATYGRYRRTIRGENGRA